VFAPTKTRAFRAGLTADANASPDRRYPDERGNHHQHRSTALGQTRKP
jgi:hypothetical protein